MTIAVAVLGVLAGVLTTLAGQGGGLFLLLACSALLGPHAALAVTAPALLFGNLHRAVLYRRVIDRSIALRMIAGALPGAFVGGLLAGATPSWLLNGIMVVLTALALARAAKLLVFRVPDAALAPSAFGVGAMTGTAGGAGVLLSPILLATGLTGRAFVGTMATIAVAMHFGRVVAYGLSGFFTARLALVTLVLTLAIAGGNAAGDWIRTRTSDRTTTRLEYGVLVMCVVLSLAGVS